MKGQGALEYLMTYGWALLVVVVVGAALYSLGVLNPATYARQACTGFMYFNAREFKMNESGNFTIIVDNGPNRVSFGNMTSRLPGDSFDQDSEGGVSCESFGTCLNENDQNVGPNQQHSMWVQNSDVSGSVGTPYTVEVRISYYTSALSHEDVATCTGKYESG